MIEALPAVAIGGGLAGAAFALELARNAYPVVVLERARGPHHKVCGELLSGEEQDLLRSMGIDVHALGASDVSRIRLARSDRQATAPLPLLAAGLSRLRLDEALLVAAEEAGATVARGVHVTGIDPGDDAVVVKTDKWMWRASAVALATGKHSLRALKRPPGQMIGFKMHLEPAATVARELASIVQLVFFQGGYTGACLVEDGILCIAWVMQTNLVQSGATNWPAQKSYMSRQSNLLADLLSCARPLIPKPVATASIPYGFLRTKQIAPLVFPVGDQLAVVPSFTGDGMAMAISTGLVAARAILAGQSAADYQRDMVWRLRREFRIARGIGRLLEMDVTSSIMVGAASVLPSLMTKMAATIRFRHPQL